MESQDQFTVTDVLLSENPVILTINDLQVQLYDDEEVLIEYTLVNLMAFKDVVDCVINSEKENYYTKEDWNFLVSKLKAVLHNKRMVRGIASFIGVLSFVIGIIMVINGLMLEIQLLLSICLYEK